MNNTRKLIIGIVSIAVVSMSVGCGILMGVGAFFITFGICSVIGTAVAIVLLDNAGNLS